MPQVMFSNEEVKDEKKCHKEISRGTPNQRMLSSPAPYSTDFEAIEERRHCNYDIKISTEMASKGKAPRKIRIFVPGIFDLFHNGHAECFRQAKNTFPLCEVYLIAGITSDVKTHSMKGLTVQPDTERAELIRHIRYVDEVMVDAPWAEDDEFLTEHKIDFVAHDDEPYMMGSNTGDLYADKKEKDMFVVTKRTEGISTTDIISKILKMNQEFANRNLNRGVSKADLGMQSAGTD